MKPIRTLIVLLALIWCGTAHATLMGYNFQFDFIDHFTASPATLSGILLGELQPDNDTVLVDSVAMAALNGVPFDPLVNLTDGFGNAANIVSFSGNNLYFCAAVGDCDITGFFLGTYLDIYGGSYVINGSHQALGDFTNFNFENSAGTWALTPGVIPIPSTLVLFAMSLIGLGWVRRRSA